MSRGIVDRYSEDKGFGYIIEDDGKLVLVERDSINMVGYKTLIPGDKVTFDMGKSMQGPVAKNVKKL